jgi:hypothetical protein
VLSVEAHEDDLREIARRGCEDAATTDQKRQAEAVGFLFPTRSLDDDSRIALQWLRCNSPATL